MSRRIIGLFLIIGLVAALGGTNHTTQAASRASAAKLNVLLYIDGSLGDLGFFDSAERGVTRANASLAVTVKTVQQSNPSVWQSDLARYAKSGMYSIIICGTSSLHDQITTVAKQYPKQKFIFFDDIVTLPNVASITYLQNEGSFLAGALAALVTNSKMPLANHKHIIGAVGGQDIPVINDFMVGYKQGATYIDPQMHVLISYVGGSGGSDTWNNPVKGAQLAKALYQEGADVVFNVAGGTGLGVLKASSEVNRYSIGVDSDQNALYPGHVLSSMVKRVDNSLFDSLQLALAGHLAYGKTTQYGLANQGVGLVMDKFSAQIVPAAFVARLNAIQKLVQQGKIHIASAESH